MLICVLLLAAVLAAAEGDERPLLEYFYENYCGSCHPDQDFEQEFAALTGERLSDYRYRPYNTAHESGRTALFEAMLRCGIEGRPMLPLAIVGGEVFMGSAAIAEALPEYALTHASSTDSVLYYLYVPGCADCARAKALLDALPAAITAARGRYEFESAIVIHRVNILEETAFANALFDAYSVPEAMRYAPMILSGERYFETPERLDRFLRGPLYRAEALGSIVIEQP